MFYLKLVVSMNGFLSMIVKILVLLIYGKLRWIFHSNSQSYFWSLNKNIWLIVVVQDRHWISFTNTKKCYFLFYVYFYGHWKSLILYILLLLVAYLLWYVFAYLAFNLNQNLCFKVLLLIMFIIYVLKNEFLKIQSKIRKRFLSLFLQRCIG